MGKSILPTQSQIKSSTTSVPKVGQSWVNWSKMHWADSEYTILHTFSEVSCVFIHSDKGPRTPANLVIRSPIDLSRHQVSGNQFLIIRSQILACCPCWYSVWLLLLLLFGHVFNAAFSHTMTRGGGRNAISICVKLWPPNGAFPGIRVLLATFLILKNYPGRGEFWWYLFFSK